MPNEYLHGTYGELGASQNLIAVSSQTPVAYVGTLPVHLIADYSELVNRPIRVRNYSEAVRTVGYSDDWKSFTLCEAIDAHFSNSIQPIGPIYLINVLDPDTMRGAQEQTELTFSAGIAMIPGDKTILNTVELVGLTEGEDYSLEYVPAQKGIAIRDLKGTIAAPVTANYFTVSPEAVSESSIIGEVTDTGKTGLQAIGYLYSESGVVPAVVAAPGWSKEKNVHDAMVAVASKVNGKFYAFALSDIPMEYEQSGTTVEVKTISAAQVAQTTLGFMAESEKTAWPMAQKVDGNTAKVYHISTLTAVAMQQTDLANGGLPFTSPSNMPVDATGYYFDAGSTPPIYEEDQLNELNKQGITSIVRRGGTWRLWGPHTAAYKFGGDTDARAVFDSSMRMLYYVINDFLQRYADVIDTPLTRNAVDTILDSQNSIMDVWVAAGALLYADIQFVPSDNSTDDILDGDFKFRLAVTTTPMVKSITGVLSYSNAGVLELSQVLQEEVSGE